MSAARTLRRLLDGEEARVVGACDRPLTALTYDSRQVEVGGLFVAVPGFQHDGLSFVPEALRRGASAVVSEADPPAGTDLTTVGWAKVPAARKALAQVACAWFDHPSRAMSVCGITGTNGKTTVTALMESLLGSRGPAGRWSTTLVRYGDHSFPTPRTTPEAPDLQRALAGMRDGGCWAAAIEVSSHALSLHRVDGTHFSAATFTNLSPDHLDFHRTMEAYLDAKGLLFERLAPNAPAIVNASDERAPALRRHVKGRLVTFGRPQDAHLPLDYSMGAPSFGGAGTHFRLDTPGGAVEVVTPLFGRAMIENITAAFATAVEMGVEVDAAIDRIAEFGGEPGRLETVQAGQDFGVLVDFAHTPAALEAAIEAARATARGRLIVVFGCGGDRDRTKRPQMGAIAAHGADIAIVTSDNPRSEDPDAIIADVLAGIERGARSRVRVESDRRRAIELAVDLAGADDTVLLAGKGHERQQTFADRTIEFDDRAVVCEAIAAALQEAR